MSRCGECKLGCNEEDVLYCEENLGYEQCIDKLQDALYAADRPRGEWIRTSNDWIDGTCGAKYFPIHCSICNYSTYDDNITNFCPFCGARMRRVDDE